MSMIRNRPRTPWTVQATRFATSAARRWGPQVARYAARKAGQAVGNWIVRPKKRSMTEPPSLTNQYDVVGQYRRKKMPRRKKRAWIKFCRKVTAVQMKNVGTRSIVFNNNIQQTWQGGDDQKWLSVHLFGYNGAATGGNTQELGLNDMKQLFTRDVSITNAKAFIGSGVLDITARNVGASVLEVDVYKIMHMDKDNAENRSSFKNDLVNAENQTGTIPSYQPLTLEKRGVTPFQIPKLGELGYKVLSKKKHLVGVGGFFTVQLRDARNLIQTDMFSNIESTTSTYILPYKTQTLLFVIKSAVGGGAQETNSLVIGATRTYMYKEIDNNTDFDGHQTL